MKENTTSIIIKFRKVHGKKYDYSQVDFISSKLKVKIGCKDHGIFEQRPDHHLEGKGCFKCGKGGKKFDLKYVIEQFHLVHPVGLYDYSQAEYINAQSDIKIICTKHKTHFFQTVSDHKRGYGCPMCKGRLPKDERTKENLLRDIYGNKYNYPSIDWANVKLSSVIHIECREHGEHIMSLRTHLMTGC